MSKFRTTEISDPEFESNHLRFITVKTPNLKGRGDICVFVPPVENLKDIPIVTLLHGVYGSAWIWAHKAGVLERNIKKNIKQFLDILLSPTLIKCIYLLKRKKRIIDNR